MAEPVDFLLRSDKFGHNNHIFGKERWSLNRVVSFILPLSIVQESDDLLENSKQRRIVTKQSEYHKRMYNLMISPARVDPFADGKGGKEGEEREGGGSVFRTLH